MKTIKEYLKEAKSDWDGTEFSTSEDINFKAAKLKLKADVEYVIKQKGKVLEIIDNDNDEVVASLTEKQVDDFFEEFGDDLDIM
jgi:DNA-binding ferritin-like protein